jgi:hypothetical protein
MVLPNLGRSVMSDLQFSRAEIDGLAQKLGSLQPELSEREQQLLVAIFAAARSEVRVISADSGDITVTDLRAELLKAFIPDDGSEFIIFSSPPPGGIGPG